MSVGPIVAGVGLGVVTGVRCFTAIAAVSWGAHLGWLPLDGSRLAFLGSTVAVAITTVMALGEYVTDQMAWTPSRVSPGPLFGRIGTGGLCGAAVFVATGHDLLSGAVHGAMGAVIGAVAAWYLRGWLVKERKVRDLHVGLVEDLLAAGGAIALARLAS